MPKTTATDIWALDCLLVQHIARRQAVFSAIGCGDPPSTNRPDAILPSQWDHISICWSVKPEGRPPVSELCLHFQPIGLAGVALSGLIELACVAYREEASWQISGAISPDGKYLAFVREGFIDIWDVDQPFATPLKSLALVKGPLPNIYWCEPGDVCAFDGILWILEISFFSLIDMFSGDYPGRETAIYHPQFDIMVQTGFQMCI
ncbi:hypothetical protein FRC02_008549 [Tulasnella sp. 418]|nr:hypothetical protein FRC02_008549 [Tulasnella sp. 418]